MNILVYGAGVLGSLYAARLKDSGHEVTLLARGRRLSELMEHGIILEDALSQKRSRTVVDLVSTLKPDGAYDLILVIVRKNHVHDILPALAANWNTPSIAFMMNNAAGLEELTVVGKERLLLGFPGGGGTREGHVVRYLLAGNRQPTSIGEPNGKITYRLDRIAATLRGAGFPVAVRRNMDAWLKTHVALVSPLANALYMSGGELKRMAGEPETLGLLVQAVREGFRVLRRLGIPLTPGSFHLLERIPASMLIRVLQKRLVTEQAELAIARHANAARDEMKQLADEFQVLARQSGLPTPAIDRLYTYVRM